MTSANAGVLEEPEDGLPLKIDLLKELIDNDSAEIKIRQKFQEYHQRACKEAHQWAQEHYYNMPDLSTIFSEDSKHMKNALIYEDKYSRRLANDLISKAYGVLQQKISEYEKLLRDEEERVFESQKSENQKMLQPCEKEKCNSEAPMSAEQMPHKIKPASVLGKRKSKEVDINNTRNKVQRRAVAGNSKAPTSNSLHLSKRKAEKMDCHALSTQKAKHGKLSSAARDKSSEPINTKMGREQGRKSEFTAPQKPPPSTPVPRHISILNNANFAELRSSQSPISTCMCASCSPQIDSTTMTSPPSPSSHPHYNHYSSDDSTARGKAEPTDQASKIASLPPNTPRIKQESPEPVWGRPMSSSSISNEPKPVTSSIGNPRAFQNTIEMLLSLDEGIATDQAPSVAPTSSNSANSRETSESASISDAGVTSKEASKLAPLPTESSDAVSVHNLRQEVPSQGETVLAQQASYVGSPSPELDLEGKFDPEAHRNTWVLPTKPVYYESPIGWRWRRQVILPEVAKPRKIPGTNELRWSIKAIETSTELSCERSLGLFINENDEISIRAGKTELARFDAGKTHNLFVDDEENTILIKGLADHIERSFSNFFYATFEHRPDLGSFYRRVRGISDCFPSDYLTHKDMWKLLKASRAEAEENHSSNKDRLWHTHSCYKNMR